MSETEDQGTLATTHRTHKSKKKKQKNKPMNTESNIMYELLHFVLVCNSRFV